MSMLQKTTEPNCPRCKITLRKDKFRALDPEQKPHDVIIDKCPHCAGIWLKKGQLEQAESVRRIHAIEFKKLPTESEQYDQLFCPNYDCDNSMMKVKNTRDQAVIMDVCSNCEGVWLDGGEFDAIQNESAVTIAGKLLKWIMDN